MNPREVSDPPDLNLTKISGLGPRFTNLAGVDVEHIAAFEGNDLTMTMM